MSVCVFYHPYSQMHEMPKGHPERVDRIVALEHSLRGLSGLDWRDCPAATRAQLEAGHETTYLDALEAASPTTGMVQLDADTSMSPGSLEAASHAVGGACAAVDLVMSGDANRAFVAMRPPGHHAERDKPMGFCLYSTIALAAKHAAAAHGLTRIAIIDFDVHHGNGTQDVLWDDPNVHFVSSHQMPLWPGSGAAHETGAHGQIQNIALKPHTGSLDMRRIYEREVLPVLDSYAPELVMISAGFDAHTRDPLANLDFQTDDFAWLTDRLREVAEQHAQGRIVSTLEGGYDLSALAESATAHIRSLQENAT